MTSSKKTGGSKLCLEPTNAPVSGNAQSRAVVTPSGVMNWLGGLRNIFTPNSSDLVNSSNIKIETPSRNNNGNNPPYKLEESNILKAPKTPSIRVSDKQIPGGEAYSASANQVPRQLSRLRGGRKKTLKRKRPRIRRLPRRGKKTRKN
tara:strand:- start:2950 stop:3393 length:444 start_codon:yes stop_codon:yes gene_type:complete